MIAVDNTCRSIYEGIQYNGTRCLVLYFSSMYVLLSDNKEMMIAVGYEAVSC